MSGTDTLGSHRYRVRQEDNGLFRFAASLKFPRGLFAVNDYGGSTKAPSYSPRKRTVSDRSD
ncbi:hypothetical protein GCM10009785_28110 [Brooklawnia cerclae]